MYASFCLVLVSRVESLWQFLATCDLNCLHRQGRCSRTRGNSLRLLIPRFKANIQQEAYTKLSPLQQCAFRSNPTFDPWLQMLWRLWLICLHRSTMLKHIPLRTLSGSLALLLERKAKLIRNVVMEAFDPKLTTASEVCTISCLNNFFSWEFYCEVGHGFRAVWTVQCWCIVFLIIFFVGLCIRFGLS